MDRIAAALAGQVRVIRRLNKALTAQLDPERFEVLTLDLALGIERGYQVRRNPDLLVFRANANLFDPGETDTRR